MPSALSTPDSRLGAPGLIAVILLAGIVAALNIGKLPPALPVLQTVFSLSLVQASYLVSVFQLAGVSLGLFGGLLADRFGPRRVMLIGLAVLTVASTAGSQADGLPYLLSLRALESAGFMLTVLPGPALLRRHVAPAHLSRMLGGWGCYMPGGMAIMMVCTPWLMAAWGWEAAWLTCGVLAALAFGCVRALVPADPVRGGDLPVHLAWPLVRATVGSAGPWWLALCFGLYAGQFIVMFSFLPSAYAAAGVSGSAAASLSALGVAANLVGNLASGVLLTRGVPRHWLIALTSAVMAVGALTAFAQDLPFALRFAAVLCFSAAGGLIPGTLFATAPRFAPHFGAVATTTGLMQQGSSMGQFLAPPLVAAVVSTGGGWNRAGAVLALLALANLGVAWAIGRYERGAGAR